MKKQKIIRVSRLERILQKIEEMTELMEPAKAEGVKYVISVIRKELEKEE